MITIDEVADLIIRINGLLGQSHEENRQLKAEVERLKIELAELAKHVREPDKPKTAPMGKE